MSSTTFNWLAGLLDPLLDPGEPDPAAKAAAPPPLAAPSVLALALSRLATGDSYHSLASRFGVSVPAARAAVHRVRRALLANFRFWLAFPPPEEGLPSVAGVDGCCGALSCARFGSGSQRVAAQIVADATSRIINLTAGLRGDRSDSSVLRMSSLFSDMEEGKLLSSGQFLVADGEGYPLLSWLMVPFPEAAAGSGEADYNAMHSALCRPVRKAVASLRGWGVFRRLDDEDGLKAAAACIGTCAMLHNVLLMRGDCSALAPDQDFVEVAAGVGAAAAVEGDSKESALRKALVLRSRSFGIHGGLSNT